MKQIIGRKMGMTQVFASDGTSYAVTVVQVLPNVVTQIKTLEKDGYSSLQVGVEDKKENRCNKCEKGIFEKAAVAPKAHLFEIKNDEVEAKLGDEFLANVFAAGDIVDVIGTSKGKGYTGAIKRWNMSIGPKGHGSGYHRAPGSFANNGIGINRVLPGKHMSGHSGNQSATIQNLLIVEANIEKGYILINGGIPGPKKGFVKIQSASKTQFGAKQVVKEILRKEAPVEKTTEEAK